MEMKWRCNTLLTFSAVAVPHLAPAQGIPPMPFSLPAAPPGLPSSGQPPEILACLVFIAVMALALIALAKSIDFRRKRVEQAVELTARIVTALLEDEAFVRSSVMPVVHIPFWRGSPARIEMRGAVPSPALAQTALRLAAQAAARVRPDLSIENALTVTPAVDRPTAGVSVSERPQADGARQASQWWLNHVESGFRPFRP